MEIRKGTVRIKGDDNEATADVMDLSARDALSVAVVDGSGNQITSFGGSGGTAEVDDAAFTAGVGSGTPMTAFATSNSVDAGDVVVVAMDTARNLKVSIEADNVGIGGGTQYTEDAAAAANPIGNALIMVRDDALSGQTTADGDNVAARGTDKGELYVKHADVLDVQTEEQLDFDTGAGSIPVSLVGIALPASGAVVAGGTTTNPIQVADAGGSLTVDNAALAVVGGGVEATALRVTVASDSTGVLSVDDNGAALTVDNAGTFAVQVDGSALTALQLIDDVVATDDTSTHATGTTKGAVFMAAATPTDGSVDANDLGAVAMSTDRRLHVDAQIAGQDADVTIADGGNAITVDWAGTAPPIGAGVEATALRVTVATDSTGVLSVDDNAGSLTVDNAALSVTGGGVEATALRVTLASDSTGLVSVDDNSR